MAETRVEHVLNCSVDRFWEVYFDDDFNRGLFFEALQFHSFEVLTHDDSEDELYRVVKVRPKLVGVPTPVQKIIGEGFTYEEEGTFDKEAKTFQVKIRPNRLAGKFDMGGVLYCLPAEEGKIKRIFEATVRVKVFGVGSLIEKQIIHDMHRDYDTAARFTNQYLSQHSQSA